MISRKKYLLEIEKWIGTPLIKVITGMRRSGKSEFLKSIIGLMQEKFLIHPEQILYIDKEDLAFSDIKNCEDLHAYLQKKSKNITKKIYIFIDEVQEIAQWEQCLRSYNAKKDQFEIFITGSNATLLSGELATFLTGRYIEIHMYPLVFSEFLEFRKQSTSGVSVSEEFKNFMLYGGLPGIHQLPFESKNIFEYLSSVFDSIVFRDIIHRYSIQNGASLQNIFFFLSDNIGNIISGKKIYDFLKTEKISISLQTVQEYLQYFQNVFLLKKVQRYDLKGKRILQILEKYYLQDIGLRHFVKGKTTDAGRIIENIVYLELLARGYSVFIGKIYEKEIDFIAEKDGKKEYIQVCLDISNTQTREREVAALLQEKSGHKKYILSLNEFEFDTIGTIPHYFLLDWLLDKKI